MSVYNENNKFKELYIKKKDLYVSFWITLNRIGLSDISKKVKYARNSIFYTLRIWKLNRIKNISLYDLSTDFNTRIKKCNIKMRYNVLRLYNIYIKILILFFINTNYL